jgi:hypothetical protein
MAGGKIQPVRQSSEQLWIIEPAIVNLDQCRRQLAI